MNFRHGSKVWVEDRDLAWVAADVTGFAGKQLQLVTASGKKVSALPEKLFPRDADEEEHGGVEDMTRLAYLNEPGVLYNLQRRYALNDIYTYTGSILIAVNPFTKLPHLYDIHMMEQYKGAPFGELSPHVFAVADASYRAMMDEGQSQSILVSGESGAGKTETTKLIMQYLTYVGGRAAGDDRTVEQQVLESNPLLEAFGNARTVRNDNSSRFGKFVEIQFDSNGRISGAAIRTYLLERSRVVQITDPERNYHCFYQLCSSERDAEKYKLGHRSHFHYLNQSKTYELEGVSSAEEYMKTRRAMDIVGISHEDQEAVFRILAGILHLGNIEFSPGKEHDSSAIKDEKSRFHLQMAADLFMCDVNLLLATLCSRSIQTREGSIVKALDCNAAVAGRDALAKTVYARLFDWLVEKINKSVGQDNNSQIQIGVLDIYGFECFKDNSFEQFCINFANEKLQQHFNEHVFKMEQEEYSKEEINWSYIEFIDNQDVLDLIEKKPIGIIALLDEACMFPKSTHQTFSTKLFQHFRSHPRLAKEKFSETDFTISHYAGKVTYHTDSFLDKNRDYVVVEHCNLLSSSKCRFVCDLFPLLPEESSSRSSYKFSSVASRFKQQLQALMETLNTTEPHYIRCVKPNSLNRPQRFENSSVIHQLRCGGVLEAVRISLAGYPTRRTYAEFVDRFGLIAPELMDGSYDEKTTTEKILQKLKLEKFQLGRTKVFLRAGQIGILDSRRAEVLDNAAKFIQRRLRTFITHREFISIRSAAFSIQAYCRGCLARKMYAAKREAAAAVFTQKYIRMWLMKQSYLKLYSSSITIQSFIRGFTTRQRFFHVKEHRAATVIQACWKMYRIQSVFQHRQASIVAIQCLWRCKQAKRELRRLKKEASEAGALRLAKNKLEKQLEDLTWRLHLEKRLRVSNEEAKLVQVSKLQKMLEALNLELDAAKLATINECNKNAMLQNQLELLVKEKSALERELVAMDELRKENAALKTLSGPPLMEEAEKVGRSPSIGQFSFRSTKGKGGVKKEVIDVAKLHRMKQEKVSASTMKILVDAVTNSRLSTISNALDETFEQTDKEITNEMEATAAAYHIFRNVASPGSLYIDEDDLRRFMIKEEVNLVFPLFDGAETGRIDRKALTRWVLKVYQERKALAHALSDTKTAVKQLSKLVSGILVVVTIVVWLLLMEIATTKVLLFFSSQLVLVAFMFGNTCKNIFEAIIFVFVMHPFDVGDRCVVDGVQLLVEEMNILTTIFLKLDNEKVYYPNSVLATKPISNYYRSPDMGDTVEFCVDFMTPLEKIGALKEKIKRYLERNPQHWHPSHNVVVKEIENVNKIKMALYVTHTMNFQEWVVKNKRRTELVMEIKKIFEELNIRYNLLPQAVHLSNTSHSPDHSIL